MPASSFGEKLRRLRKAAGLTQAELTKRAGCNPVSISQYEAGVCEPRDERATALIELAGGGSEPPEELKAKKRGRPRLALKNAHDQYIESPRQTNCRCMVEPVESENTTGRRPRRERIDSAAGVTPVRLGVVARAWIEQMVDSHIHARGMLFVDGQVRVVSMRRADLIDLAAELIGACGTRVDG